MVCLLESFLGLGSIVLDITNEMAEMLKSGELEFVNDTDFVKISDKTLVL